MIFAVFVGGAWLYLSSTEASTRTYVTGPRIDMLDDPGFVGMAERTPVSKAGQPRQPAAPGMSSTGRKSARRSQRRRGPSLTEVADRLARRADEASVELRREASDSYMASFARGVTAAKKGNLDEAIAQFDDAISRNPSAVAALAAKGSALVEQGRFLEARDTYEKLLAVDSNDVESRYNYAVVLYRLSEFQDSAIQLREVIRRKPDHANAHYNLASLAQREGRISEARASLEMFTRLRPDVASAWFNLGVIYVDFDMPLEAAGAFESVTTITPDDADAFLNLGIARAVSGQYASALDAVRIANELSPCDDTILRYLATLHDIMADQNASDAPRHRRMAAMLQEQVESEVPTP